MIRDNLSDKSFDKHIAYKSDRYLCLSGFISAVSYRALLIRRIWTYLLLILRGLLCITTVFIFRDLFTSLPLSTINSLHFPLTSSNIPNPRIESLTNSLFFKKNILFI